MNESVHPRSGDRMTQAAEGLPRWRWTTAELVRLTELGAFTNEDRFELIGGEIVPMSPVGRRHDVVASDLEDALRAAAPPSIRVRTERQLNLTADSYSKPDIFLHEASILPPDVRGETVLLVIEIAASSLDYDLGAKSAIYAQHGVREYWVVDAATLVTTVHRNPGQQGYASVVEAPPANRLTPILVELSLQLADLPLG